MSTEVVEVGEETVRAFTLRAPFPPGLDTPHDLVAPHETAVYRFYDGLGDLFFDEADFAEDGGLLFAETFDVLFEQAQFRIDLNLFSVGFVNRGAQFLAEPRQMFILLLASFAFFFDGGNLQ